MKKLLVLLLIVSFVGVAVFAQDAAASPAPNKLALSGRVQTGIAINGGGSDGIKAQMKDSKDSTNVLDSSFNVAYGDAAGTWGLNLGFGFKDDTTANLYMNDTNAWFKPFNELKLTIGKSGFGDYGTLENGDGWQGPDTYSVKLEVFPIDGLSFGLYMPFDVAMRNITDSANNLAIGAKYKMAKVFGITAQYFLNADGGSAVTITGTTATFKDTLNQFDLVNVAGTKNEGANVGEFTASASLDAVENLTVAAGVDLQLPLGKTIIAEKAGYDFGVVNASVYGKETLQTTKITFPVLGSTDFSYTGIYINPNFAFKLVPNVFNPSLGLGLTFDTVKIGTADAATGTEWKVSLSNDFTVGNGAIRVGVDVGSGNSWGGAVGNGTKVNDASATSLGTTDLGWDIQISYNLTWSN